MLGGMKILNCNEILSSLLTVRVQQVALFPIHFHPNDVWTPAPVWLTFSDPLLEEQR
jgi:hypothetical protein